MNLTIKEINMNWEKIIVYVLALAVVGAGAYFGFDAMGTIKDAKEVIVEVQPVIEDLRD